MDRDIEKTSTNSGTLGPERNDTTFATIQSPQAIRTRSRASASISRCQSQNGYSCNPHNEPSDDEVEKDPFEVGWDGGDNDSLCPRSFHKMKKWLIIIIVSSGSLCVTAASSIYTSTYGQMEDEFGNSREVSILGLSFFVLGIGLGPMFLGPLSEFYGRRLIYVVSWTLYVIFIIPQAVAQNIETVIVSRFLDGFAGSAFLAVSGGTVGDLFTANELQAPMLMFSLAPFVGPSIGPLIGGFINYNTDWRWTHWTLLIWAFVLLLGIVFLVPETYHPILLKNKAKQMRKETGDGRWKAPTEKVQKSATSAIGRSLLRPFQLLIFEPMCLNLCIFTAIVLGVFGNIYGFNLWQNGCSFLGILVGMLLAAGLDPLWHNIRNKLIRKLSEETGVEGNSQPEFRLPPAILGGILVPVGIFMFAWSCYPRVHWIVPIVGSAIFGAGILLVFSGVFTFLVDAYPQYAASALAANAFVRCVFAAAFPLFGNQMYTKLNNHWASSLLAFLTVAMMPFPYLFFRYGKRIRANSRFATS
ncbi:Putative drug/proton antiporter YHK8 [Fusarium oxysporum f. sp. cubense race 1]|uniref:Putative drug/proton antiporter YHK8 n=1 Tax=Fusarium oxysporum f. sp. cubense (strain race 1) TaxID=1229664 RepID=N4TW58_FUSC1|nr:Putative drug/proton antiporter YHK8 [Fusarium oxysporum f. sp. cubense race 1]